MHTCSPQASPGPRPVATPRFTPHLELFAAPVLFTDAEGLGTRDERRLAPLIAVSFDYDGRRVGASDAESASPIARDPVGEARACRELERHGAVELACLENVVPLTERTADYLVRLEGSASDLCRFSTEALPRLQALGWQVAVADDYPYQVVAEAPQLFAEVVPESERPGWFALELGIEVDGRRIDLLPMLIELLEDAEEDTQLKALAARHATPHAVRVSESRYVLVAGEQLSALLRVLVELYQGVPRRGRRLSFPAVRAAALGSLERALAGSRGRVRLAGPEPVLRRVRQLVDPVPELGATVHGLRATLRPYQRAGVAFLQHLRELEAGGVLADDMGLGKTLQTIAHLCVEKARRRLDKPELIVAPTSVVPNWERELARFAPHLRVVVLTGAARRERFLGIAHAEVVLTSYPLVVRDEELLLAHAFSTLVLDEAQAIKNVQSLASQALRRFDTEHRICLTGTPIENHLGELWSIVDFLSPGLLGDELSFRRCYRQPIEEARDAERVLALRDQVAPYVLRRVKHDVAPELPPKTELLCPVELEGPQRELYENIRLAAHGDVRRLIRAKGLSACTVPVLDALLKLRQVCCDPRLLSLEAARGVTASAKFDALLELLDAQLAARHRVLVFSQFTSMLELVAEALRARGIAHLALTGATRERQRVVDAFEAGAADVFLISLKAGGTGLNLTSADSVVHYDPWWNPAAQTQATDRAYRIGQDKPVFVHRLYVAGSVEERVIHLQQKKAELAQAILGVGATALDWNEGDIEGLFAPLG